MAGVLASIVVLVVVGAGAAVYAGMEAKRRAEVAKQTASHETPEQQAALDAKAGASAPGPGEPAPDASVAPPPRIALPQQGKAFVDRFDTGFLHERWMASDGWSNGDWTSNDWQASQIQFTKDGLRIVLEKSPEGSEKPMMGGEIRTNEFFRYGYFEMKMKMPRGMGIIMGFFTYAGADGPVKPHEIDIEILGRHPRIYETALHEGGSALGKKIDLPFDSSDGFHTYGFDWQPDGVRWYADGKLIHSDNQGRAIRIQRPQQLMISLWASDKLKGWLGPLDVNGGPYHLDVRCAGYAPAYTGKQLCAN